MNEKVTNTTLASTQKINDIIKKAYNKSSYSIEKKSHSNEKYEYDNDNMTNDFWRLAKKVERTTIDIKDNAIEVVNTLEENIGNDVIKEEEISLLLRFRLQRQNVTIEEKKFHQYAPIIERIVKINNVVNIKNHDDNDWTFKDKATTLKMYQKELIKKSNDEKHRLRYESIIFR